MIVKQKIKIIFFGLLFTLMASSLFAAGQDKRVRAEELRLEQKREREVVEFSRRANELYENPVGFALFEVPDIQRKNKEEQEQKVIEAREIGQRMRARLEQQRLARGEQIPVQPLAQPQPFVEALPLDALPPKNYYLGKLIGALGSGFIAKKYYDKKQAVFLKALKKIKNSSLSSEEKELAIKELSKTWNKYGLKDLEDALYLGGAIGSVVIGCLIDSARK